MWWSIRNPLIARILRGCDSVDMERRALLIVAIVAGIFLGVDSASSEDLEALRPPYYKKWRKNPKVCHAATLSVPPDVGAVRK